MTAKKVSVIEQVKEQVTGIREDLMFLHAKVNNLATDIAAVQSAVQKAPIPGVFGRKLCKDCRHARPARFAFVAHWEFAKCVRPTGNITLVTGAPERREDYCNLSRENQYKNDYYCGHEGKYWEAK